MWAIFTQNKKPKKKNNEKDQTTKNLLYLQTCQRAFLQVGQCLGQGGKKKKKKSPRTLITKHTNVQSTWKLSQRKWNKNMEKERVRDRERNKTETQALFYKSRHVVHPPVNIRMRTGRNLRTFLVNDSWHGTDQIVYLTLVNVKIRLDRRQCCMIVKPSNQHLDNEFKDFNWDWPH